jgi:predicted transcriptional regulator
MTADNRYPRDVRLDHEGLCRLLGHREACIMEALWDHEDVSVREIHSALSKDEELAYTTVMTITDRLWKKGLLARRKRGKTYLYTPKSNKESFVTGAVRRVFDSFVPDLNRSALSHFVDTLAAQQPELLEELERLLRERGGDA